VNIISLLNRILNKKYKTRNQNLLQKQSEQNEVVDNLKMKMSYNSKKSKNES
jgi:hypothetical protein